MNQEPDNSEESSIIKSIMVEQEERTRGSLDPLAVAIGALGHLKDREREILGDRFGLEGGKKVTLETVGKKFQITRERVRQIEAAALKRLVQKPTKELAQLVKVINSCLLSTGGLISLDELAEYLKIGNDERREAELNALRLVMSTNDQVVPLKKSDELKFGWMKKGFLAEMITPVIGEVVHILESAGRTLDGDKVWSQFVSSETYSKYEAKMTEEALKGIMLVADGLARARDGNWGLSSWPTVVPKRIRDKVYLILEQTNEPMHFTNITEALNHSYPGKKVLSRTVHNELIGDPRFILVGRGIYALKGWGYKPGVVADVIKEVLAKAGRPLSTDEIVTAVLKSRQVKHNTVIANLQNRELFKKVSKGVYTLA